MKTRILGYWAATALTAIAFAAGGIANLLHGPAVTATLTHLGYPTYLATLLGSWKVAGAIALLLPRFPRLKEWAYAGMFFDLSGAFVAHLAAGDGPSTLVPPLALTALMLASWALRPESRRLEAGSHVVPSRRRPVAESSAFA